MAMPISFVPTVLPAVPGLREVDVVEGQDEYTTEVGAMVEVVEEAEGGLQQFRKLAMSTPLVHITPPNGITHLEVKS